MNVSAFRFDETKRARKIYFTHKKKTVSIILSSFWRINITGCAIQSLASGRVVEWKFESRRVQKTDCMIQSWARGGLRLVTSKKRTNK